MRAQASWNGSNGFKVEFESSNNVITEWGEGRKNPSPMELFLSALSCCTGVDVIEIIKKMRKELRSFSVTAEGKRRKEYPQIFTEIKLTYELQTDATHDDVDRAIRLSMEKYCSVRGMLRPEIKVDYMIKINNIGTQSS